MERYNRDDWFTNFYNELQIELTGLLSRLALDFSRILILFIWIILEYPSILKTHPFILKGFFVSSLWALYQSFLVNACVARLSACKELDEKIRHLVWHQGSMKSTTLKDFVEILVICLVFIAITYIGCRS